jgi:hypothetical protein
MPQHEPFSFAGAPEDIGNFQALYEKAMGLGYKGRNLYNNWLASRWQEAVANWGLSKVPEFNRSETDASIALREDESFESYVERLKGSEELFGGTRKGFEGPIFSESTGGASGPSTMGAGYRLDQINKLGGIKQREIEDWLNQNILAGSGVSGSQAMQEAFLNQQQSRFGRRGGRAATDWAYDPTAYRQYGISPTGALAPDIFTYDHKGNVLTQTPNQSSFLNQRLAALRARYGFSQETPAQ